MKSLISTQVIENSTQRVMSDKSWLEAPEEVVLKVLQMESMQITEASLFSNLVKWGRAQVQQEEKLRLKIKKCLKLIRFCTMDAAEFSSLCCEPIPLSEREKYKILLSINQKSPDHLPESFCTSEIPRCMGQRSLYSWMDLKSRDCFLDGQSKPCNLTVAVDQERFLTAVKLFCLTSVNAGHQMHLTCDVYSCEHPDLCIASATFDSFVQKDAIGELSLAHPVLMKRGIFYIIKVTYKLETKRSTMIFKTKRAHSVFSSVPLENMYSRDKVTIMFAIHDELIAPVNDICGLVLAKNLVPPK